MFLVMALMVVRSPPTRAEWIEILTVEAPTGAVVTSPPTRAEWIEMLPPFEPFPPMGVSAHTGGVD